jgi:hypothetical protein
MHSDKGGGSMLKGKSILLRPVHQSDLNELYARHIDIANRGSFYPLGLFLRSSSGGGSRIKASGIRKRG